MDYNGSGSAAQLIDQDDIEGGGAFGLGDEEDGGMQDWLASRFDALESSLRARLDSMDGLARSTAAQLEGLRVELQHSIAGLTRRQDDHELHAAAKLADLYHEIHGTNPTNDPGLKVRVDRAERTLAICKTVGVSVMLAMLAAILGVYVPACERVLHHQAYQDRAAAAPEGNGRNNGTQP
jgi:hypothetical protein